MRYDRTSRSLGRWHRSSSRTNYDKIVAEVSHLLDDADYYTTMSRAANPYGDGKASERIRRILHQALVSIAKIIDFPS